MNGVILTAAEMRVAEAAAIGAGTPAATLMERAGAAAAEAIRRFAGPLPTLVLCGPGNNGGDGYVIARRLAERGIAVRVAALGEPATADARSAAEHWRGPVEALTDAAGATILVDALFGTGLTRPLDAAASAALTRLGRAAAVRIAIDLPSGVATDDGSLLSPVPDYDLTITIAALKPAHLLQPAARHMGRIAVADIGLDAESQLHAIEKPKLSAPGPDHHKYRRGYVAVVGGEMPGATALTASASLRGGAGYVRLIGEVPVAGMVHAIVQSTDIGFLADARIGALAIGPGLGRTERARDRLGAALAGGAPLILDADALVLLHLDELRGLKHVPILTPHEGEFSGLFGDRPGSKLERAREAARRAGAVVIYKGPDTVVAGPDGRAAIAFPAPAWLASAGTGDVLTGIVAALRANGADAFEAACSAVWIHGRSAERAGPGLIADDLVAQLPAVIAECL